MIHEKMKNAVKRKDSRPFKVAKNIKMMVVDPITGEKAKFGSKKTIIEVYKKETDPLINLYKDKNLIYLNGDGEEEEIFNELRKKLDPFTE